MIDLAIPAEPRQYRPGDTLAIEDSTFVPTIDGRYEVLAARRHGHQQILTLRLVPPNDA